MIVKVPYENTKTFSGHQVVSSIRDLFDPPTVLKVTVFTFQKKGHVFHPKKKVTRSATVVAWGQVRWWSQIIQAVCHSTGYVGGWRDSGDLWIGKENGYDFLGGTPAWVSQEDSKWL